MKRLETLLTGNQDHNYCVVNEVSKLMDRGFTCYLEYEILIGGGRRLGYRAVVDIYAVRGKQEILIEVGTLSVAHGDRIALLQRLKPNAKVIHVHQWKNYGINDVLMRELYYEWKMQNYFNSEKGQREILDVLERL